MPTKSQKPNILALAGPNSKYARKGAAPAGFWVGLWHGIVSPFAFVIGLFTPNIRIYETKNNGKWYDFGFVLGVGSCSGPMIKY